MPAIIDSLFLELGIDTTKFSADEKKALAKIQQFEASSKRAAAGASSSVKSVGAAFRDLASESRIGASADRLDNLADKFKGLGASIGASGGMGAPFGAMAKGLGMLLSPAALGAAAIGLVGAEVWDFNKDMTAMNATLARNAELSGMSTANLWAMGEATKTVGGNPAAVEASIAGLQTAFAGAAIGVGNATSQLVGMARLSPYGARFNPGGIGAGANEESLFKAVRTMYLQRGRAQTMALVTQYGLMNEDQANLAMSPGGWAEYQKALALSKTIKAPGGFESVVRESLKSQVGLGEMDIQKAINAEQAYGGIQAPMQTIVGLVTSILAVLNGILGGISTLVNFFTGGKVADAAQNAASSVKDFLNEKAPGLLATHSPDAVRQREMIALDVLRKGKQSELNAEAMVGNFAQENGQFDPFATSDNGKHIGIAQLDQTRQAAFAKWAKYKIGSTSVSPMKQLIDQVNFSLFELKNTHGKAQRAMDAETSLLGKTVAFQNLDEMPGAGDNSFLKRFGFAREAQALMAMLNAATSTPATAVHHTVTSETKIGDIHVHTPSTDPKAHGAAIRSDLNSQPLLSPAAMGALSLSTRGMTG